MPSRSRGLSAQGGGICYDGGEAVRFGMAFNYLFFFAGFGVFLPFFSPFLETLGYSKTQIGLLYTSFSLFGLCAPLAGRISDKRWGPARTLKVFTLGMFLSLLALTFLLPRRGWPFLAGLWAYATLRAPIGSLQDTIAMSLAGEHPGKYASMRVVGSIGFALSSAAVGWYFQLFGLTRFFQVLLVAAIPFALTTWNLKDPGWVQESAYAKSFWQDLSPNWWWWLAAMTAHWFCFAPFHYGFTFLLSEQGVRGELHGVAWSLGVLAEVLVFLCGGYFFSRWHYRPMLFLSFFANLIRWGILGMNPPPLLLWATQLLHGLGFALFFLSALKGISEYHGGRYRASYQTLFATTLAFACNIIGITLAGWLHQRMSMSHVFLCFLPAQLLALAILWKHPLQPFALRRNTGLPAEPQIAS